ncbi:tripartite tricarboxylate transporter permease [Aminobacter sp. J44]|uniref:tripartite tricarboxylate transporter permease n=1 Tax=Aminobacter sp. J44 TaxID=935262 RepID=UPI00119A3EE9|nr:tripartite tricarboxylate transporter permease [Aminobacter sp. J44]TWG49597.1 TctA family transporter [Aminobacter sp. J44]
MFAELVAGLGLILQWPSVFYLLAGVVFGLFLGIIPGLGGITGMIVLLPFTFGMEPAAALAMLLGILAVGQTSDTIASVMLGIPGSVAAQATILDGHPMAKKGLAQTALGAAFTVSAAGGVVGALVLAASLPILIWLVLAFGSPEFFVLAIVGLFMVGAVSGNAISKGVAAAAVGLLLSQVGYPVTSSTPRYWFGYDFLLDGLPLVPVVIGLFGIPEMMALAGRGTSIADTNAEVARAQGDSIMAGVREAIKHRWIALRCSMLGTYIGILPGLGASVVDWLAYGHVVQTSKDKENFGKGDIRGVIAPESANNAVLGGSLIPTISFGIPGSGAMAIFLGALTIHGFVPGRDMLTTHLDITFSMIWAIIIANIVGALAMMAWSKQVTKAAYIDGHLIVPAVITFLIMGAWLVSPAMSTLVIFLLFGVVGYLMKVAGWPRPPLLLGFVLGPVMEEALTITAQSSTFVDVISRPTVIALVLVLLVVGYLAIRSVWKNENTTEIEASRKSVASIYISVALALLAAVMFAYGFYAARGWTFLSSLFPMVTCAVGVPLALAVLWKDRKLYSEQAAALSARSLGVMHAVGELFHEQKKELAALLTFAVAIIAIPILGQVPAILLFTALYLVVWGRYRFVAVTLYTAAMAALIYALYHRMLHTPFEPSAFIDWSWFNL